jgi:hypothetical protein
MGGIMGVVALFFLGSYVIGFAMGRYVRVGFPRKRRIRIDVSARSVTCSPSLRRWEVLEIEWDTVERTGSEGTVEVQ